MSESIQHCVSCGEAFEASARFCPHCGAAVPASATGAARDPFVGRVVSQRYTVEKRLAHGGMGEIYLAKHAELNQRVAVKFLHARFADDDEFAARFFNEAQSACRVNHPNAVAIYDFGRLDDGTLYIVMEFVEGLPLKSLIERDGPLPPRRALTITQLAADVLSAAHDQSIVHRDVKPDNIMVVEAPGGRLSIKMLDFGIAKMVDDDSSAGSMTATGVTFGTPEYMSPEQAMGSDVDGRSDIYSLGVCLYAMLAGHPPFQGKNKLALLQRHIREQPPPIEHACPVPLSDGVVQLVHEMLDKVPERRPQSMESLANRLDRLAREAAAADTGPGHSVPKREPPRRGSLLTHRPSEAYEASMGTEDGMSAAYAIDDDAVASTDGFSLGDEFVSDGDDGAWSLGEPSPTDTFEDSDVYLAPRRNWLPVIGALAVLLIGLVGFRLLRGGDDAPAPAPEPEQPPALVAEGSADPAQVVSDGSGDADGSGTALIAAEGSAEPEPPPAPRDEVGEAVGAALAMIERGDIDAAEATLQPLIDGGAGEFTAVRNARNRLEAVQGLVRRADRGLAQGNCREADAAVVELQERYSRALGMTYWGQLDACRAAAAAAAAPAPTPAPERPDPPAERPREREPERPRAVLPPDDL